MRVEVEKAPPGAKGILRNLMQLYFHDMTEFAPRQVDNQGLFTYEYFENYWSEESRHPFLIRVDGAPAGFAFVRFVDEGTADMAEFFVVRAHRRGGVGSVAAKHLFDTFKGRWQIRQEPKNFAAQEFWRGLIQEYTGGEFVDLPAGDETWHQPLQRFDSRNKVSVGSSAEEA
jgi:predicted acetyltransferase